MEKEQEKERKGERKEKSPKKPFEAVFIAYVNKQGLAAGSQ